MITLRAAREYITQYVKDNHKTLSEGEMARDLEVSEQTIRNYYKKLRDVHGWGRKKMIRRVR